MSETIEGIGGRKWSFECAKDTEHKEVVLVGDVVMVMEGKTPIAALTDAGERVKLLIVTAPQLWDAANEHIKAFTTNYPAGVDAGNERQKTLERLMNMVAKAVGATDWKSVQQ